ncbi:AT-rich interactive domain-containing protein 1-like [Cicer arietinum]|uniref:AT-rich interactive domain-containing protein 1-like n=1 Tax=Cicer arietinum TaxID=3827 RepID=UPI003CC5B76A
MLGSEQPLDLYKLFMVVKDKGGYDVVCKNRLWDLVGEEYGLGVKVGSSVELVYSKYLSTLETPLKNVVDDEVAKCGLVDDRVKFGERLMELQAEFLLDDYGEEDAGDELESVYDCGRKLCGTNRVKGVNSKVYDYLDGRKLRGANRMKDANLESNAAKKVKNGGLVDMHMEELDGNKILAVDVSNTVNKMPGLSDGSKRHDSDDNADSVDDVLILDPSSVNRENFGRKRKRESMSEVLSWVTRTAKNPCDPVVGSIPEKSKWKSCRNEEIWKKVLLFRESVFLKKDFGSNCEKLSWLAQRMHPAMYDDNFGATYNLRQRIKCDNGLLAGKSASKGIFSRMQRTPSPHTDDRAKKKLLDSSAPESSLDTPATVNIPLGPNHQAEVPKWTGTTHESDSKWLGTQIWPQKSAKSNLLERDPIGKGGEDSCGCHVQGSVECVRFHIAEKRAKVKLELGVAFYQWNLDKVGEDVRRWWTLPEEEKFNDIVKSNPASLDRCFWDDIFKTFPKKSRENLVSYYFNVFLLQRRGYQNRHTPDNIDSDDDESEFTPLRGVFGHKKNKSNITLLSPKKPQSKPHTKGR